MKLISIGVAFVCACLNDLWLGIELVLLLRLSHLKRAAAAAALL